METLSALIKRTARETGFSACGITRAEAMPDVREQYLRWTGQGFHGEMAYLERDLEKRTDPRLAMEGAVTVICLAWYYQPDPSLVPDVPFRMGRFALGKDYHAVLKERLETLAGRISLATGPFQYRAFVDSGPLAEKALAVKSGIGWMGKNTLIQLPGKGSWFLTGEILTDLEAEPDQPFRGEYCGNCNRCITACPTGALTAPYTLDARRCLSYLTIETKGPFNQETKLHGHIYGCDICQEVCPFNHHAPPLSDSLLEPDPGLHAMTRDEWNSLDENSFRQIFSQSGVKRLGRGRLVRNLLQSQLKPTP